MIGRVSFEKLLRVVRACKERVVSLQGRVCFSHATLVRAVERRYLGCSRLSDGSAQAEQEVTEAMVLAHRQLAAYFETYPDESARKCEEYPFQLCHCVGLFPADRHRLEAFLLRPPVLARMSSWEQHDQLAAYWRIVCYRPGSLSQIAGPIQPRCEVPSLPTGGWSAIALAASPRLQGPIHPGSSYDRNPPPIPPRPWQILEGRMPYGPHTLAPPR